jgi:hypothetical protein
MKIESGINGSDLRWLYEETIVYYEFLGSFDEVCEGSYKTDNL